MQEGEHDGEQAEQQLLVLKPSRCFVLEMKLANLKQRRRQQLLQRRHLDVELLLALTFTLT